MGKIVECKCEWPNYHFELKIPICNLCNNSLSKIDINQNEAEKIRQRIEIELNMPVELRIDENEFQFVVLRNSEYFRGLQCNFFHPVINLNWSQFFRDMMRNYDKRWKND